MGVRPLSLPSHPRPSVPSVPQGAGTLCALESTASASVGTSMDFPFPVHVCKKTGDSIQDAWASTKAVMTGIVWEMAHCGDGWGAEH